MRSNTTKGGTTAFVNVITHGGAAVLPVRAFGNKKKGAQVQVGYYSAAELLCRTGDGLGGDYETIAIEPGTTRSESASEPRATDSSAPFGTGPQDRCGRGRV